MSPQEISYWFTAEVKPHEGELRGFLYNRLDEISDAEDIIQETFRRIVEVRRKKPVQYPKHLLFTIAQNLLADFFRKRISSKTSFVAEIEDLNVIDTEKGPFDLACRQEELDALTEAIQSLPPKCRTILILRRIENHSYKEIANKLNISESTVETQLTRGLQKCQQYMKRKGLVRISKSKNNESPGPQSISRAK